MSKNKKPCDLHIRKHFIVMDEVSDINEDVLRKLEMRTASNIKFNNGSSIKFHSVDIKDAGRGSSPFVPHPCQEDEFAFQKAAEQFSSNIIENGMHFSIKVKMKDGSIFIEEENMTNTNAPDDEYILFSSKKK